MTEEKQEDHGAATNISDYPSMDAAENTPLRSALLDIIEAHGKEIFSDTGALEEELRKRNAAEANIYRVCLIIQVKGFQRLLNPGENTLQNDLDRFVYNATRETGLNRGVIMSLTSDLISLAGVNMEYIPSESHHEQPIPNAYPIPWRMYSKDLQSFQKHFNIWLEHGIPIPEEQLEQVQPLVAAEIPAAQYYMGYYMLKGAYISKDPPEPALTLLQKAASAGESRAAAALGDYYYENSIDWNKAYLYYTSYGFLVLNQKQQTAILHILNRKIFNEKIFTATAGLFAFFLVLLFLSPGTPLYPRKLLFGMIATIINAVILIFSYQRFKRKSFDNYYYIPFALFTIWAIYTMIRFIF